jgi:hypothetical protein
MRFLKTLQGCLIPKADGSLTEFCMKYTKAGMMRNGRVYRLSMLERRIAGSGYGLSAAPARIVVGTPTATVRPRSAKYAKNRATNPAEFAKLWLDPAGGLYVRRHCELQATAEKLRGY